MNKLLRTNVLTSPFLKWLSLGLLLPASIVAANEPNSLFFDKNDSYWAQYLPEVNPPLNRNLRVDVAIIGGGYTGLSAAYHIKKSDPDLNVAIFEAKRLGNGASGRNGGLVLAQTYSEGGMAMGKFKKYHREIYDITVNSMKRLKTLAESTGIDPEFVLNGQCAGIFNPENVAGFKEYATKAQKLGMPIEFLGKEQAVKKLGAPALVGAVCDPNGGMVNPAKLVAALTKLAKDAGVEIYEQSIIEDYMQTAPLKLTVLANNQRYKVKADAMVIAANAYAAATLGFMEDDIVPSHTQVAVTAPLTEEQYRSAGWLDHIAWYDDLYAGTDSDATYHMIMTQDRRIVIGGGSVEYSDGESLRYPGDIKKIEKQISKHLGDMYPSLKGIAIEHTWDGIIAETNSKTELIGVTGKHENIFYALGYNGGQGVNASFLFGELVSKLYNDEDHPLLDIIAKYEE